MSSTRALRALAALLSYPDAALVAALPEIGAALAAERRFGRAGRARLAELVDELAAADLVAAQENYVALFDRGRATALNLFEHVHGDSRDRGQAMVDLAQVYERAGLRLATRELPDSLPVLLEFLSTRPLAEARAMLADCAHVVRAIGEALARRGSRYAAVPAAALAFAGEAGFDWKTAPVAVAAREEEALDREWVEEPVTFGCGSALSTPARAGAQAVPLRFVRKEMLTEAK